MRSDFLDRAITVRSSAYEIPNTLPKEWHEDGMRVPEAHEYDRAIESVNSLLQELCVLRAMSNVLRMLDES